MVRKIVSKVYPITLAAIFVLFVILLISIVRTSIFGEVDLHKYAFFEISFLLPKSFAKEGFLGIMNIYEGLRP